MTFKIWVKSFTFKLGLTFILTLQSQPQPWSTRRDKCRQKILDHCGVTVDEKHHWSPGSVCASVVDILCMMSLLSTICRLVLCEVRGIAWKLLIFSSCKKFHISIWSTVIEMFGIVVISSLQTCSDNFWMVLSSSRLSLKCKFFEVNIGSLEPLWARKHSLHADASIFCHHNHSGMKRWLTIQSGISSPFSWT